MPVQGCFHIYFMYCFILFNSFFSPLKPIWWVEYFGNKGTQSMSLLVESVCLLAEEMKAISSPKGTDWHGSVHFSKYMLIYPSWCERVEARYGFIVTVTNCT